jgi:hypothetical protein
VTLAPQDFPSDPLELDPAAEDSPVVAPVGPLRRLQLTEPVRLYLYPVALALLALLVALGVVDDHLAPTYEALIGAVLAVGARFGIEGVRASVWSERSATQAALQAGRAAARAEREHGLSLTLRAAVAARKLPAVPPAVQS